MANFYDEWIEKKEIKISQKQNCGENNFEFVRK